MTENRIWTRKLLRRFSRRRMLAGGAALGAGMYALSRGRGAGQEPASPRLTPSGRGGPTPWPDTSNSNPKTTIDNLNRAFAQAGDSGSAWPGTRKDYYLPFLFMRAFLGDTGTRPLPSTQLGPYAFGFPRSPDILIQRGSTAAPVLSTLGNTATQNTPNTVYAHVWNLGFAPAYDVFVEFAWSRGLVVNPLGQTWVNSLGARGSGESHKLVTCPNPWNAPLTPSDNSFSDVHSTPDTDDVDAYLLVRVQQFVTDPLGTVGTSQWDSRLNRHIAVQPVKILPAGVP